MWLSKLGSSDNLCVSYIVTFCWCVKPNRNFLFTTIQEMGRIVKLGFFRLYSLYKTKKYLTFAETNGVKWLFVSVFFKGRFLNFFLKVDCTSVFRGLELFLVNSLNFLIKQILDVRANSSLLSNGEI